ncbi:MAG: SDR family oxidoreductase [Pseudomonadota bacterium]
MAPVALITGGTRGIGRGIVAQFVADHDVALTWRSTPPDDSLAERAYCIQADLSDPGCASDIATEVINQFGRLDVIVNNAGIVTMTPKDTFDAAPHHDMMNVNVLAPQALLAAALPHLKPGAAIVNISSMNADLPPRDAATYGASKAALNLWTRAMAKELGPLGIRVNAVAPGAIERPEAPRPAELIEKFVADTALGRPGTPDDIAAAVRFLASERAGFITGEILTVSGGYRL